MSQRMSRRQLLAGTAVVSASLALSGRAAGAKPEARSAPKPEAKPAAKGPFVLPPLPYSPGALAPVISARTLSFHHGKHHLAYVEKANELVAGSDLASKPVEEIIRAAAADPSRSALFNNAAQAWNHTFYWNSMKPKGGGAPTGALLERVKKDFGSVEDLKKQLTEAATTQFGSGWAWLVAEGDKLKVVKTSNADTPIARPGMKPLLTVDVWEHAYYLDWQNKRKDYVQGFLDKLVDWEFAAKNLG